VGGSEWKRAASPERNGGGSEVGGWSFTPQGEEGGEGRGSEKAVC